MLIGDDLHVVFKGIIVLPLGTANATRTTTQDHCLTRDGRKAAHGRLNTFIRDKSNIVWRINHTNTSNIRRRQIDGSLCFGIQNLARLKGHGTLESHGKVTVFCGCKVVHFRQ